jgi:hypothetical protein
VNARAACEEIAANAMALAALPAGDPERVRAEEHGKTCPACTRAFAEAQQLLAILDELDGARLPEPSAAALARASAPVLADLDARQRAVAVRANAGRLGAAMAAAVVAAWALPLALARGPIAGGGPFALSFGLAALAAIASAATVRWGGRLAIVFPVLSVVTALLVGTGRELDAASGLHCALIEAMTAAGVGGAAWLATRALARTAPNPKILAAAVGGGALAGHAALHLACAGATELPHVLVFHTGPVALFVALALLSAGAARLPSPKAF